MNEKFLENSIRNQQLVATEAKKILRNMRIPPKLIIDLILLLASLKRF